MYSARSLLLPTQLSQIVGDGALINSYNDNTMKATPSWRETNLCRYKIDISIIDSEAVNGGLVVNNKYPQNIA